MLEHRRADCNVLHATEAPEHDRLIARFGRATGRSMNRRVGNAKHLCRQGDVALDRVVQELNACLRIVNDIRDGLDVVHECRDVVL